MVWCDRWWKSRVWTRGLLGLGLGLGLLSSPAWARLPEPPAGSDVAVRLLPWPEQTTRLDRRELSDHPIYRLVGELGSRYLGFEPLKFLDTTFEGTLVAAVLSGSKGSSLGLYLRDRDLRDKWDKNVEELRSLSEDLEGYRETTESYPTNLQNYIDEIRYYEPYLSQGVSYRYEVLGDGQDYRLTLSFEKGSELARLGPPPEFSSREAPKNLAPTARSVPLNYVVGARILDKERLEEVLTDALGPPKGGFWSSSDPGFPLTLTFRGDWLVGSDRRENLGSFIKCLQGAKPGWSGNPSFQLVSRNIDTEAPMTVFVDLPHVMRSMGLPGDGEVDKLAGLLGPMGYSAVPLADSQMQLQAFVGVNPPTGSRLQQFFAQGAGRTPAEELRTTNIPWDVSNVFALNYDNGRELVDALVALFPEAEEQYGMSQDIMLGMFGFDAQSGFQNLLQGSAIVSFERIDFFAAGVESFLLRGSTKKVEEQVSMVSLDEPPSDQDSTESEKQEVRKTSPLDPLAGVPMTFAFQMPVEQNREALVELLEPLMGDPRSQELYGVELLTSEDGRFSYALDGDRVYLSGGRTDRLIRHMLEAAHGRKATLGTIDSWSRFSLESRGRLLGFGHQKIDAFESIVKGFLLLMGSEFRPLATEIGRLRDYHSVITAVPDGLLIRGEVAKGDNR